MYSELSRSKCVVVFCLLFGIVVSSMSAYGGFLEIKDGYFYDTEKEEYFIPHGIAYQIWNPPVYANQTTNQVEYDFREMKRMHVNSLRVELTWSQIETNEGCYDYSKADYLINLAEEMDMKLYMLMGYQYPPGWFKTNYPERMAFHYDQYLSQTGISDVLNYNCPEAIGAYASYVSNLCERYKDYTCIGGWIVGNEFAYYDLWEPPNDYPDHRFLGYDTNFSLVSFQNFLSNRYSGTIAELNTTWDTTYSAFQDIPMPIEFPTNRKDQPGTQHSGYTDVLLWRQQTIAEFLSAGVGAAKSADTNHLVTYAMVGGIFSGFDANNTCEDARAIVTVCNSNNTPVDFWTINNYPWTWTGTEMRSMDFGVAKYRDTIGLPVMLSECGLSDNDILFTETVYRQKNALAGITWEAMMSGAIGAHIFHWNDRPEFFSYDNVLLREGGFGIINGSRLVKDVYWNVLDAYRRMDEMHLERLMPGSTDPVNDLVAYWSKETDLGFGRYNQEFAMIWAAFKRMGFQIGIMDEDEFDQGMYTNVQAVFLPRNNQMEPERFYALETNVLANGVNIFAESDLPGQYNSYYGSNANWYATIQSVFGLNVSNASPGFESGASFNNYDDYRRLHVTIVTNQGLLSTNFSMKTWKIWHGITNVDATVIATHTGVTNMHAPMPAVSVKQHGAAAAAFASFAIGDEMSDTEDSPYWEHTWDVRTMILDGILKESFHMDPVIKLSGDTYARYVVSDYRTCSNGTVLLSLLNMCGPDHPVTNLVIHAPSLLNGKKVENLTRGGIVTNQAGDEITVSVAGDEFLLLYLYDSDGAGDHSIISTNKAKIWFENGQWSAPSRVYPSPEWQVVNVGYDIPAELDWENVRVAFERVMPDGSYIQYGASQSNWVAPGSGSVWTKVPIPSADLGDTNYISTCDGGEYVLSAWCEDMGEQHCRTEIPVELYWSVRPVALPTNILPSTSYDITVEWQDIPSYLEEEGECPVNRARQWPLSDNYDVKQSYSIVLELMDAQTNSLLSTNVVTIKGTDQHTFTVMTPPTVQSNDWWRALLVAEPITDDFVDSFEDRVPGNNKTWFTNDAPMVVWMWGSSGNLPLWWDEGIGIDPVTHGKQANFLIFKTKSTSLPAYSGHSYFFNLGQTNDYSSLSLRSNIWLSMDFCMQDTNGAGTVDASIELSMLDSSNGKKLRYMTYTNFGGYQTFKTRLSDITSNPPWPGTAINWSRVSGFTLNAKHLNANTPYVCFLDNVRLTGTPVRVGTGGITNGIFLSNGDHLPSPNPDRLPRIQIYNNSDVPVLDRAVAAATNGTDYGLRAVGASAVNTYKIMVDYGQDLTITGVSTGGPGALSYVISGIPETLSPGGIASNFTIRFDANREGTRAAWFVIETPVTNFIMNLNAQVFGTSMQSGPAGGGNVLTITNLALGGAAAVTNILVDGLPAVLAAQGNNWIDVVMPAHGVGYVDIVLQTMAEGDLLLESVYQYNPAGEIGWSGFGPYGWSTVGSGMNNSVTAMAYDETNQLLYAGGAFTTAGGVSCNRLAVWDGVSWTNLGLGLNGTVYSIALGSDSNVYVGGNFSYADGLYMPNIACWNGVAWTNLGDGFGSTVRALAVGHNGELYAGGFFTNSGSLGVNRIAMWNGTTWTNLNSGMNNLVYSLSVGPSGELYAGGSFSVVAGSSMLYAAVWDGTNWHGMSSGFNQTVMRMYVGHSDSLYAGGLFTYAGSSIPRIARWQDEAWTNIGIGVNNSVNAIADDASGNLYAAGSFTVAGGYSARSIARWDGVRWYPMGDGLDSTVYDLVMGAECELFACGLFNNAGSLPVSRIARWAAPPVTAFGVSPTNGVTWGGTEVVIEGVNLGNGDDITNVTLCGVAVASIISQCSTQLVVESAAGMPGPGDVAVYSTSYGTTIKSNAFNYGLPDVLIQGTNLAWIANNNEPAADDGSDFEYISVGEQMTHVFGFVNNTTNTMTVTGVTTAGTHMAWFEVSSYAASIPAGETGSIAIVFAPISGGEGLATLTVLNDISNYLVNVSGAGTYSLSPRTGPSTGGTFLTITNLVLDVGEVVTNVLVDAIPVVIDDSGLNWVTIMMPAHAAGAIDILIQSDIHGDTLLEHAYTYNPPGAIGGTAYGPYSWNALDNGLNNSAMTFTPDGDGGIYVGGSFSTAGSSNIARIAQWTGSSWTNLGSGANNSVLSLTTDPANGHLYAGGYFTYIGGCTASYIAKWNGEGWTNLNSGVNSTVYDIEVDTNGHVYACGQFTMADGNSTARIAKWDGSTWTNLGSGLAGTAYAMELDTNGNLYVAGSFITAGGLSALRVAMWNGTTWTNLGTGLSSTAKALALDTNGVLYVGGQFSSAGGVSARYVAKWDGSTWSAVGEGFTDYVLDLDFDDSGTLYAAGEFFNSGTQGALCVAKWNGTAWTNIGDGLFHPISTPCCYAIEAFSDTCIYAGGLFLNSGLKEVSFIAKWQPDWVTESSGVAPSNGPAAGGVLVTITGTNLCDGSDVTNVTICGVAVSNIISQTSTQLVVETGASIPALGDVAVYSTSFGATDKGNAYRYLNDSQIYLQDLNQYFDGVSKWVTATTDPSGLMVSMTYNGSPFAPANSGIYVVTARVENLDYYGVATDTLVIEKAVQSINFANPGAQVVTNQIQLSAEAGSDYPIRFALAAGPAILSNQTSMVFTDRGYVSVVASQEGNENWAAADDVTNMFRIYGLYTVSVYSVYGTASPVVGQHVFVEEMMITNSVTTPQTDDTTQFVCCGWALTGSDPLSGTSNVCTVTVTNSADLTWLWATNYWLDTDAGSNGQINVGDGWQSAGITTGITAMADSYYHFTDWTGDATGDVNPLEVLMDGPKSIAASFAENLTTNRQVPEKWLAEYGITNAFETAVNMDHDGDQVDTWQEYMADTCPTDAVSHLHMTLIDPAGISWVGGQAVIQYIEWSDGMTNEWVVLATNTPPTAVTNTLGIPGISPNGFYRIRVER